MEIVSMIETIDDILHKTAKVIAPRYGNRNVPDGIFHYQRPANNPGDQFPEGHIRISISTPRDRNHRRKFGISKSGKTAGNCCKQKKKYTRRTSVKTGFPNGAENTRTNDGCDSKSGQISCL